MLTLLLTLCLCVLSQAATNGAQTPTATLRVQVRASDKPVVDAEVIVAAATHRTDASGTATVTAAPGQVEIRVAKAGFLSVTTAVTAAAGTVQDVTVALVAEPTLEEEVTVVRPIHVARSPEYVLSSLTDPTTNMGVELLGTFRREPFSVTATYTYVQARETVDVIKEDVPLTPRHSAGLVGMWEVEDEGRVGVEWYFTGAGCGSVLTAALGSRSS